MTSIKARSNGTIQADTNTTLIDLNTNDTAVVEDRFLPSFIIFHADSTLTNGANLSLGISNDHDYFVPSGVIFTTDLNNGDIIYNLNNNRAAIDGTQNLILRSNVTISSGQLSVYIGGFKWNIL